ncbi:3-oxoadipate enol-lactonase [Roseobacter cerasinus]|uniref:3-oxoadipate enol-lactonase n=1 Tax=Roseobacter cerasinus TaxID=2602289 RepID=A0A640VU55_9RHOB|nr:alpha/beta hydrolase [Roseobacter cerasinus]GFE51723.1 3-oxoadipate enol-lactonase [Roseobacter cerasinus]
MLHRSLHGPAGAPVITCLHAVGISSWMWQRVIAQLPEYRVLLIDLPGHGESRDTPWVSLPDTADLVAAAIRSDVDTSPVHLTALSLGSYVGLHLVLRHPDLCTSALLSGIHPGQMPNRRMMKLLSAIMAPLAPRPAFARRTARMMGAAVDVEGFVAAAGQTRASAFRRATNDVLDFDCTTLPAQTGTRLAFVAGSREHMLIRDGLDVFSARFAGSITAVAPGLGHGWAGEDPALFAQFLRAHIEGTPLQSELSP